MGLLIKHIHIKPGTELLEGVKSEEFDFIDQKPDEDGKIWCKVIYVGFDYKRQYLYVYLSEYWPDNNAKEVIPKLPECLDHNVPLEHPFYQFEPNEGLIGYDFKSNGKIMSEYVGEIFFKKL